jgi:hypothetical protein
MNWRARRRGRDGSVGRRVRTRASYPPPRPLTDAAIGQPISPLSSSAPSAAPTEAATSRSSPTDRLRCSPPGSPRDLAHPLVRHRCSGDLRLSGDAGGVCAHGVCGARAGGVRGAYRTLGQGGGAGAMERPLHSSRSDVTFVFPKAEVSLRSHRRRPGRKAAGTRDHTF